MSENLKFGLIEDKETLDPVKKFRNVLLNEDGSVIPSENVRWFGYPNYKGGVTIYEKYQEKCNTPSDINELLPYLKEYAEKCEHITEFGVRNPTSTYAFLAARPKELISYDIGRYPEVDEVEALAKAENLDFTFILQDVLEADIEETDFLFIDTAHTATQCERELKRHAHKVKKYLGFHDYNTFFENGEPAYNGADIWCGRGLRYAIEPFLAAHPEWQVDLRIEFNNGLLILKRHE